MNIQNNKKTNTHYIPINLSQIIHKNSKLSKTTPWRDHMGAIIEKRNKEMGFYFRLSHTKLIEQCYNKTKK